MNITAIFQEKLLNAGFPGHLTVRFDTDERGNPQLMINGNLNAYHCIRLFKQLNPLASKKESRYFLLLARLQCKGYGRSSSMAHIDDSEFNDAWIDPLILTHFRYGNCSRMLEIWGRFIAQVRHYLQQTIQGLPTEYYYFLKN